MILKATEEHVVLEQLKMNISNGENVSSATLQTFGTYWTTEYIILAIYLGILALVGILGNIPVLIVYFHRNEQTASNTFIKALAILDLGVCVLIMPYTMIYELHLVQSDFVCRTFEFIRHFSIFASSLTLVAIAAERYIAVCRISHKMSVKSVKQGILFIFLLSSMSAAPSIGIFAVVSQYDVKDVQCRFRHEMTIGKFCHFTYSIVGESYALAYQGVLMVLFFVSLIIIVILYIIIYIVLWQRTQFRKRALSNTPRECSNNSDVQSSLCEQRVCVKPDPGENEISRTCDLENDESEVMTKETPTTNNNVKHNQKKRKMEKIRKIFHRRTAKMLFLCTVIYLLTWLPFWIDIFGLTHNLVFRYLFFIGNTTNPIVYGIVNSQIRREFRKLISGCFLRNRRLFNRNSYLR